MDIYINDICTKLQIKIPENLDLIDPKKLKKYMDLIIPSYDDGEDFSAYDHLCLGYYTCKILTKNKDNKDQKINEDQKIVKLIVEEAFLKAYNNTENKYIKEILESIIENSTIKTKALSKLNKNLYDFINDISEKTKINKPDTIYFISVSKLTELFHLVRHQVFDNKFEYVISEIHFKDGYILGLLK